MKYIRPTIRIEVYEVLETKDKRLYWDIFRVHHYMGHNFNVAARCWIAFWDNDLVGFCSALALPSGHFKNGWREHRLVILPDYQGLGIGNRLSEFCGEVLLREGKRYYSKTANIKMGEYRNHSPKWKPTSKNGKSRQDDLDTMNRRGGYYNGLLNEKLALRVCYSHQYIGERNEQL